MNWSFTNVIIALLFVLCIPSGLKKIGIKPKNLGCSLLLYICMIVSFFGTIALLSDIQYDKNLSSLDVKFIKANNPTILLIELNENKKMYIKLLGVNKFEPDSTDSALSFINSTIERDQRLILKLPLNFSISEEDTIKAYILTKDSFGFDIGAKLLQEGLAKIDTTAEHYSSRIKKFQNSNAKFAKKYKRGLWKKDS